MSDIVIQLEQVILQYAPMLKTVSEEQFAHKPSPQKWSKKEVLGHLIDSAQNNIRRFIVAQYEEIPNIVYNQDQWVKLSNYQAYKINDLVDLWILLNKHILKILGNFSPEMKIRLCDTNEKEVHTIRWLAEDYVKHLLHHLHQILDMEPVAYP